MSRWFGSFLSLAVVGWLSWGGASGCAVPHGADAAALTLQQSPSAAPLSYYLPAVKQLAASSAGEFAVFHFGAEFAADLGFSRCETRQTNVEFTPAWRATGAEPLENAAYCLYRLTLDPAETPATLTLNWDGAAPEQCWIGLADWTAEAWRWTPMPAGGLLPVPDPARFAAPSARCYAAVVVLGETPGVLAGIGFGELPPEPSGDGYTLFAPIAGTDTYLIDMAGQVVHTWPSAYAPGMSVDLTEEGHLLRSCVLDHPGSSAGGLAGRMEELDWDGNVLWSFVLSTPTQCTHHDFKRLPNGNLLCIVGNQYPPDPMLEAGRDPGSLPPLGLWIDALFEIQPVGVDEAVVVWEWYVVDHLVQDFDPARHNYGNPSAHPELIDFNYCSSPRLDDWTHANAVEYNPALDQIALSVAGFSEIWIIDHSTTTAEAAGHSGGRYHHGGDLLYRWGNFQAYRAGKGADRHLYYQHGVNWIPDGLDGAGNLLVFNNQAGTPSDELYSTIIEFTPPLKPDGTYHLTAGRFGPATPAWEYRADPPESFYSGIMSSVQRLPGGHTLVCSGESGWFFEVDPAGDITWEFINPYPYEPGQVFRAYRYPPDYPGLAALQP